MPLKSPNMAAVGHSNMATVGNNKSIQGSPQNSLVIFTFKVVKGNIDCILNMFLKSHSMICLQIPSFRSSFQDGHQLASKPAHHKQRVARSSPIFQVSDVYTPSFLTLAPPLGQTKQQRRKKHLGGSGTCPPETFWDLESLKCHFLHFGGQFYRIMKMSYIIHKRQHISGLWIYIEFFS